MFETTPGLMSVEEGHCSVEASGRDRCTPHQAVEHLAIVEDARGCGCDGYAVSIRVPLGLSH